MEFLILQSRKDPDFYIITDPQNAHRALQEYRESQPDDELSLAPVDSHARVLDSIPNLSVVKSFIDLIGYFGHAVERDRAWPTPARDDKAQTG